MEAVRLTAVIIFSWLISICCVTSQSSCMPGWFGSACKYKCRCANGICDKDGLCTGNSTCQGGWFGPACQYADLAYQTSPTNVLTDGDNTTCNSNIPAGSNTVTVTFNTSYTFTWLRVRANNSEVLKQNLVVTFNTGSSCPNQRNATVDQNTLDIYCDLDGSVGSVTLAGAAVPYLCSIYVSGGRNVAINETTEQSTTYYERSVYYVATKAVDGDVNSDFYAGNSCSCTDGNQNSAGTWIVSLSQARSVNRYVLYNRGGSYNSNSFRLVNFSLQSFDTDNRLVFNYTDRQGDMAVYTVIHPDLTLRLVQITTGSRDKVLTLCEVEVYGDSACQAGQYGRECEHTCNCAGGEPCFVSTGGCSSGCAAGFQGQDCNTPCSPGTYGSGCVSQCSDLCVKDGRGVRSCDIYNGTCLLGCVDGYQGSMCTSPCDPETYGPGCSKECSEHCTNKTMGKTSCDHVNGTCQHGCESGYKQPLCLSPCDRGRYGPGCTTNCSSICVDTNITGPAPCHHVTGVCMFGCLAGYHDLICQQVSEPGSHEPDNVKLIGIIVGCVVGVIVLAIITAVLVFFLRRRRRIGKPETNHASRQAMAGNNYSPTEDDANNVKQTPQEGKAAGKAGAGAQLEENTNTPAIYYNSFAAGQKSTGISVNELADFMTSKDKDFFTIQFSAIPANQAVTMIVGLSNENKHKNRYKNVCAYDHSRVHLKPNAAKKQGDYINASYIEGYKPDEKFIASQGPTKIILEDFVRMLWEQQVEKVVMLTNLVEEGKQKCERYWPEDGEIKVGEITITLTTTQVFADYTIRRLQLKKDGSLNQDLIHFHFTSWPDKDIPNTPWGLVDFEQRVASYPTNRPIVVHCSAGVGRTGTFIALRNVMREAEETGQMDFFTTVQKLRQDRINMIQTADQYIFLHKAALVAILCIGTTVTSMDIERRIVVLGAKLQSGQTKLEKEFHSVCSACDDKGEEITSEDNPYSIYENSQTIVNTQKNRVQSILPKEIYRAKLRCENNDMADYINAVLVPSFSKQNQQILTQLPLPSTVTDFWRLVTQYKVTVIVAFQADLKSTDPNTHNEILTSATMFDHCAEILLVIYGRRLENVWRYSHAMCDLWGKTGELMETIADYLPLGGSENIRLPMFTISTKSAKNSMFWKQQEVSLTIDKDKMQKFSVVTTEHHLTHFACTSTDLDKGTLLAITQQIRSLQPAGSGRILYMCRNGADYSGLVCVLSLLLDRMDNDHHLTVPLVVGAIKAIRPQVIPTLDQYKLLYEALQLYSESFNEYTNFGRSSNS